MKKPKSLKIPVVVLFVYSIGIFSQAILRGNVIIYYIMGTFIFMTSLALSQKYHWSRFLIYFLTLITVPSWVWEFWRIAQNGWPYARPQDIWYFINAISLNLLYIFTSIHVFHYFKDSKAST